MLDLRLRDVGHGDATATPSGVQLWWSAFRWYWNAPDDDESSAAGSAVYEG